MRNKGIMVTRERPEQAHLDFRLEVEHWMEKGWKIKENSFKTYETIRYIDGAILKNYSVVVQKESEE